MGKGGAQKPLALARVYTLVLGESEGGSKVVTSIVPILGFEASVLYDSGATTISYLLCLEDCLDL